MDAQDTLILRAALATLKKFGTDGLGKKNLLSLVEYETGALRSTEQNEALWTLLTERRYVTGYIQPVTNREYFRITERGLEALECL